MTLDVRVANPVPPLATATCPVNPLAGATAAVIALLQPKPVLVVQINALPAAEHDDTACAVGEATPDVAFTSTVLAACVAWSARVTSPVAVNDVVTVAPIKVGP